MGRGTSQPAAEERIAQQLDALYAGLPKLDCKGKCWKCCGPVLMSPGERDRVRREYGAELPTVDEMRRDHRTMCPALKSHRCTVYTARPLVCRLWGIEETMRCPYGCVPEGGWMTEQEATGFWTRAYAIAGWPVEKEERLTSRELAERVRQWERQWASLPETRRARILPDGNPTAPRRRSLLRWRQAS
jgi:hypothetical protein